MSRPLLTALAALLAACASDPCHGVAGSCVELEVTGEMLELDQLELSIIGDATLVARAPAVADGPISLPATYALELGAVSGTFILTATALHAGTPVAWGRPSSPISIARAGDHVSTRVGLAISVEGLDLALPPDADLSASDLSDRDLSSMDQSVSDTASVDLDPNAPRYAFL